MRNLLWFAMCLLMLASCRSNVFQTGRATKKGFCDTIPIDSSAIYIVVPVKANAQHLRLIFDTGADLVLVQNDTVPSRKKINVTDSNGRSVMCNIVPLKTLEIGGQAFSDMSAIGFDFSEVLHCFGDGLLGNNVIKAANWLIEKDKLVFSDRPFTIDSALSLPFVYRGANRIFTKFTLNGCNIEPCLVDYGGQMDMELPLAFYEKNKACFTPNSVSSQTSCSTGLHGKAVPDTVVMMNCNVDFNGIQLNNVNIEFGPVREMQIGIRFMRRFGRVAIDNLNGNLLLANVVQSPKQPSQRCKNSFDLVDQRFVVDFQLLDGSCGDEINLGDKFVEINSVKSTDFTSYCDFLTWKREVMKNEFLDLRTENGQVIRINNLQ